MFSCAAACRGDKEPEYEIHSKDFEAARPAPRPAPAAAPAPINRRSGWQVETAMTTRGDKARGDDIMQAYHAEEARKMARLRDRARAPKAAPPTNSMAAHERGHGAEPARNVSQTHHGADAIHLKVCLSGAAPLLVLSTAAASRRIDWFCCSSY